MIKTAKQQDDAKTDATLSSEHTSEDVQEILEDLDRESRTRPYEKTWMRQPILWAGVLLSLYHMYITLFNGPPQLVHRAIHVSAILVLCFALYRPTKSAKQKTTPWYDWILMALSASVAVYIAANYSTIITAGGRFDTIDVVFGAILVFVVLEAARRLTGWALPILAILALLYGVYGRYMPGPFRHRSYDLDRILNFMLSTNEGVFSTAVGVSSTYIFLFILFGAVLAKSGMGTFFNDLALAIAGQTRGGPAKVAVLGSGLLGSINGSAIANVVTTGAFTIPMMKKIGYKPNFAGAVEAAASVGGQILPPIMGAAAFIMAETLGIPYQEIALIAIVPALLYYLGIIAQVHLRATRTGLKGISKDNIPAVMEVMRERGHLTIPLIFLIYMLFFSGRTILFSAVTTVFVTILVAQLRKITRMSFMELMESFRDGALTAISVAVACACVGIIVGIATLTGLGVTLAGAIVAIGGGFLLPTLLMTAAASIILGMGLPSIPTYIITATMAAPALGQLGVEPVVAHLFVFYFGLFANITPPVALAAFAGAGLAGGDPMRTGFASMKLAIAGFIVPFIFVYNPALLWQDAPVGEALWITATATVGVLALAVAAEGSFMVDVPIINRILFAVGAVLLMMPDTLTDVIAFAILAVAISVQMALAKKQDMLVLRNI